MRANEWGRFLISLIFILIQSPFFITVLFYAHLFPAGSALVRRTRATFATLSAAMWTPFLGLRVSTQISPAILQRTANNRTRMFLSTHQSFSDALIVALLFWLFRRTLGPGVALYKQELGRIPIMGQLQRFSGNIPVARSGDTEAAKRALAVAARRSREGYHVSGFPEGSRRRTPSTGNDQTLPLKKGLFHLVKSLCEEGKEVEIFPIVFSGSFRSWPLGCSIPVGGSKVSVRVGDPVVVSGAIDVDSLTNEFSKIFSHEIAKMAPRYDPELAFANGHEVSFTSVFGFETLLALVPVVGTACMLLLAS